MAQSKGSPDKESNSPNPRSNGSVKEQCCFNGCTNKAEEKSTLCLFHMSAEEKTEMNLWKRCMDEFYILLERDVTVCQGFILKNVDLSQRKIGSVIDFSRSSFHGNTTFSLTHFTNVALFKGACFFGDVDFNETIYRKEAVFTGSTFHGCVSFRDSRFDGKAYFKRIRFGEAIFHNTIFSDKSIFSPKKEDLENDIPTFINGDFTGVHFEKGGSFDRCTIISGNFEDSSIQNVSFREVNLDEVRFAGAQMDFAYLADSEWTVDLDRPQFSSLLDWFFVYDPRLVIREELEARNLHGEYTNNLDNEQREEKIIAYRKAESTYRRIKHSLANEGAYEKAGEFYIHEMRMKKVKYSLDQGLIAKWNYFWNVLYSWTCGFGERPKRVFLNAFIVILLFATLYAAFDGIAKDDNDDYDPSFRECLYFSVVTFTTLGYGDYAPKSSFQLVAVMEAFLGAFTIALFILVFGRKVMR